MAPNTLDRQFEVNHPHQAWVTDFTYIRTHEGWLYLTVAMDLYPRAIVGWAMDKRMTQQLVMDALTMALFRRKFPKKTIIHFISACGRPFIERAIEGANECIWVTVYGQADSQKCRAKVGAFSKVIRVRDDQRRVR